MIYGLLEIDIINAYDEDANILEGIIHSSDTRCLGNGDTITFSWAESGRKYAVRMIYLNN